MSPSLKHFLAGLLFIALAVLALQVVLTYMDSLYAYRSPLASQPPAPGYAPVEPLTRRVVFVLIDGLRLDTSLDPQVMPFLSQLRRAGASAEMHSRAPTYSTPSYAVLLTGAWPDLSDGPAMNLEYADIPALTQDHIFSIAQRSRIGGGISAYNWFEKLVPVEQRRIGYFTAGEDQAADQDVVAAAEPWLKDARRYGLVLIHLDQLDYAGHHEGGPLDERWDAAARRVDDHLRTIASYLDFTRDTLLVVSDHGHIDTGGHGGQDEVTRREPFVLAGAGIRPGTYDPVDMVDVAPTVAVLLGGNIPAASQGKVLTHLLNLSTTQVDAVHKAAQSQQVRLLTAYSAALGEDRPQVPESTDPVAAHQSALAALQAERRSTERLPRSGLAVLLAVLPLAAAAFTRSKSWLALFAGAATYGLVFHARYSWLDNKTYSLSSIISPTDFLIHTGITALLAFMLGGLVAILAARALRKDPKSRSQPGLILLQFGAVLVYLLALPALFSYAWNGLTYTWTLPDYTTSFLGFICLAQILFTGLLTALTAFSLSLAALRKPRPLKEPVLEPQV